MKFRNIICFLFLPFVLAAQPRTGRDYAVFFYVTDFQPGIDDIPFTKGEAEELAAELGSNYGFSCAFVRECKKTDITAALAEWNKKLGPNDQVLFFFSMHGYYDKDSDRGYLIPADGKKGDEQNYFTSWLSYDDLRTYLAPCKAGHILVALDACYSGSFGIRSNKGMPDGNDADAAPDCATRVGNVMQHKGRQFISAGKMVDETPKRSAFVQEILSTLRTRFDKEGLLMLEDLAYRLHKLKNPEPEDGSFVGHKAGGDFVFVRKNACNANTPDRDGDNVPDAADKCPDTWGSGPDGCPPSDPGNDNTAADLAAWKTAKATHTKAAYQEYLRAFPNGEFKDNANAALRRMETEELARRDDTAWELAEEKNTPEGYKKYLQDWPNGRHAAEAREKTKPQAEEKMPDGMVFVKGGTFQMGSETGESNEKPVHSVTVSDFYLGKYELTVAEFKAFIDATGYKTDADKSGSSVVYTNGWKDQKGVNWKYDTRGNLRPSNEYNHPVLHVSWNDATEYCKWLSKKTGQAYRLPTEAEWEYAAGGGSGQRTQWAGTNTESDLRRYANYDGNQDGHALTAPVGSLQANALGLHDMSGNVWEWCGDWYGNYTASAQTNPTGASSGSYRVIRGGSWYYIPQYCRVAFRSDSTPGYRNSGVGFRLARTK